MARNPELLRRIDDLSLKIKDFSGRAENVIQQNAALDAAVCLSALIQTVERRSPVFGIEPWHQVQEKVPMAAPGEMLLRLRDQAGVPLPPYPAIMAFYDHGMAAEIDTLLVLCALDQFTQMDEGQVSINVSGRSLRDGGFLKAVLPRVEAMALPKARKVIFEIHETALDQPMSPRVLDLCRGLGIGIAIDDLGLSMNDIIRLAEFERCADFVKLDRKFLMVGNGSEYSLEHVMALINATLPSAAIIAEGVQDAEHAYQLRKRHPLIQYVQGLHLPGRTTFASQWRERKSETITVI